MSASPLSSGATVPVLKRRTKCRGCGGGHLILFLSLGEVPLANSFLTPEQLGQEEAKFPLEVYFCEDCTLVQLLHVVHPKVLFSNYIYRSGTSSTVRKHNEMLAETVVQQLCLGPGDLVVEVASNDGSLLKCFAPYGVRTLGVEPAGNIAAIARAEGIETLNRFFDLDCGDQILRQYGPASAVIANNVLAHVDETVEFLAAFKKILKPEGRICVEVPYVGEMLGKLEYDTIYHEHLCYFSVGALMRAFGEAGLAIERVDAVEIHGGSARVWAKHMDREGHSRPVEEMAAQERVRGYGNLATYQDFARRVERNRTQILALLRRLKEEGKFVVGYGAPAKGNTLLCYCGIGTDLLAYTVDRSPLKVGLFTPGSYLPVFPFERILADQPDYVMILAWNFAAEIIESLKTYQQRGGRFVLPIPEPVVV